MRKSTAVAVIGILIVGILALAGCGKEEASDDTKAYAGKYVSETNGADYIEIEANNTFTMVRGEEETSGSCDVDEGKLRLSAGSFSEAMAIDDDVITAEDGTRFVKSEDEGNEEEERPEGGSPTIREAIEAYCDEKEIDIPSLNVSGEKQVSAQDPDWEVDYAFPAEAEGEGYFFLMRKVDGGWTVVAHTEKAGWTVDELGALGAPTDLVL